MAKAPWLEIDPPSGSGSGIINFSSTSPNTGRNARSTYATFKAAQVEDIQRQVTQAGKPENVDIQDTASSAKEGQTVTLTGTSNSKKLTFSLGSGVLAITLPGNYLANSIQTANGADIAGDPGGAAEYPFSISIVVPANEGVSDLTRQVIVTDDAGNNDICLLTLAAGNPTLTVSHESGIELDWQGTAVPVTVTSNTNWTVE